MAGTSSEALEQSWERQRWVVTAAGLALAGLVALILGLSADGSQATAPPRSAPQAVRQAMTLVDRPCAVGASGPFVPTTFAIPGVITPAPVLALARDWRGVPSVPPLTTAGEHEYAWDRGPVGIMPGSSQGNALFNAHTWPWQQGGALGNQMLTGLHPGGVIVLSGNGVHQCYRVTRRIEVPAQGTYPGFYDRTGPPQIAIISCSGVRAGPGDWLSRTIWFASPFTSTDPNI